MTPRQSLLQSRTAAGRAADPGRHPHRDRLGGRHHHAFHAHRPDQPGQLHLHRACRSRIGCSCCSAAWRRRCWRWCWICCWRWRDPAWRSVRARAWCWPALGLLAVIAGGADAGIDPRRVGQSAARHRDRRQEFRRAIYPGRTDDPAPRAQAGFAVTTKSDLGSTIAFRALARGRYRRLCRLFRHPVGQPAAPDRHAGPPGDAGPNSPPGWRKHYGIATPGVAGLRECLYFRHARRPGQGAGTSKAWPICAAHPELRIGGDFEIFSRPEWRAVAAAYGLGAMQRRQYQPDFLYRAVTSGDADVVSAFSSDGRIARYGLVILADPKAALPPYDAMLLVGPAHAHDPKFLAALKPLIGRDPPAPDAAGEPDGGPRSGQADPGRDRGLAGPASLTLT